MPTVIGPLQLGRVRVLPAERRLLIDGENAPVGSRAFDLLIALIERRDRVVTKDELLDVVWPHVVVEENNLQVHVSALRKLLGPEAIATVPGRGYRFCLPVPGDADDAAPSPAAASEATESNASSPATSAPAVSARAASAPASDGCGPATNLPSRLPALYGREGDLKDVQALLAANGLVSIVGPGGIGKTRLAQAAAHAACARHMHGAWMVELASIGNPSLVIPTIAQTLHITLPGRAPELEELIAALRGQDLLLVLDNCEHVLEAVGRFAAALLAEAPQARLLCTSQELLRLPDERLFRLAPLAIPSVTDADARTATEFGAVQLFVERVRSTDDAFEVTPANVAAIVDVCTQLDGIALALELAAARVRMLGLDGIRTRLRERFRMLTGGARVSLRRHQTLRTAFDWSHQLLNADEQKVFRRLGIFSGGFTIESAQAVACDDHIDAWAVIDHVGTLIDKSLVLVDGGARPRYRLLETTRTYALEKLAEASEVDSVARLHAAATCRLLERAVKRRDSEQLMQEMNNVRAAFAWAAGGGGDRAAAVELATAASVVLAVEGLVVEGLDRLLFVQPWVDDSLPAPLVAQYWQWVGRLGIDGRLPVPRCIEALAKSEALYRELGNKRHLHACLRMRAEAMLQTDTPQQAQAPLQEAIAMETADMPLADRMRRLRVQGLLEDRIGQTTKALDTLQHAYHLAESAGIERYVLVLLSDLADMHLKTGHADEAAQRFETLAAKARNRLGGGLTLCYALSGLMAALIEGGRTAQAREVSLEAIPLLRRSGIFLARGDIFAWLLSREGRHVGALQLAGAADAFYRRSEGTRSAVEQRIRADVEALAAGHAPTGSIGIQSWLAEGAAMSEEDLARLLA